MTTWAQVYDGTAHNPVTKDPAECFSDDWLKAEEAEGRKFIIVPDGTLHGAKDKGDGTFTNPVIPAPPQVVDPFKQLCDDVKAIKLKLGA